MQIKVCHNCPRREIGCHSTCEDYIRERENLDKENLKIKKAMWKESEIVSRKKDGMRHMTTIKKKRK